jgi:hypothetical protein
LAKRIEALQSKQGYTEADLEYAYYHRTPKTYYAEGLVETFRKREEFEQWLTQYKAEKGIV